MMNEREVVMCYKFLAHEKETELRLIHPLTKHIKSIFVRNEKEFLETCKQHNGEYLIYAGINERTTNGTEGKDVISIQTIVLDIDAKRGAGFEKQPATDKELEGAKKICDHILHTIRETLQPEPIVIHSGNGYQIWFAIPKITVTDTNREDLNKKSKTFQEQVQDRFDIDNAIDNIGDLPRIIKVWGTQNIKGTETKDRPHRKAKNISNKKEREENQTLRQVILEIETEEEYEEYESLEIIDTVDFSKLPPCIEYIIKYYENNDGNHWYRIIQYLTSFFRTIGLPKKETENILQEWNKKQPHHEPGEVLEIKQHTNRIYDKGLNVANCEKVKTDKGGFPYTGLAKLKICKPCKECNRCKNPVICWKRKNTEKRIQTCGLNITNYIENAQKFHEIQPYFYDKTKIFWFWNKKEYMWEIVDEVDVMNAIDDNLQISGETVSGHIKSNYLEAFKRIGRKNIPQKPENKYLQFKDKIVDINTGEITEATPIHFFCNPIPWQIGASEETPNMNRIFTEWVGPEYVETLYQIIGYCLLTDYPIHRIFCFIGSGMNGKSCFLRLLTKFIGDQNCGTANLHKLSKGGFEGTRIYKKLVALIGETDFSELNDTDFIKRITGQDKIGYEFKHKNPFDDYNYAKILLATNNLPTTGDKTIGFYRRWLIIDFNKTFDEKKDILDDIPCEEYSNLCKKSIRILKELLETRKFHNEGSIADRKKRYEEKSNPFDKFYDENIEESHEDGDFISKKDFKKKMDQWCRENNFRDISERTINNHMKDKHVFEKIANMTFIDKETGLNKRVQFMAWNCVKWR